MHKHTPCPLIIQTSKSHLTLSDWMSINYREYPALLLQYKALLFRGFKLPGELDLISRLFFDERLAYTYRSTARTEVGQNIYTTTEYPHQLSIPQHCENSYQHVWPMKLLFHCVEPAKKGGYTPMADMLNVTKAIDPSIKEIFAQKQVCYVRNYRTGIDLPWENVFNTNNRQEVEEYCRRNNIQCEWMEDGLQTKQISQTFARHPTTGDEIWFNQAHLFHYTILEPAEQKMMLSFFGEKGPPRNAYFGDGTSLDPDMLEKVRTTFKQHQSSFEWYKGDVLILDNMLVSHGRTPYEGNRKIFVCMAEPCHAAAQSSSRITTY